MDDCISRERLLERIRGTGYSDQIKENLTFMVMNLPAEDVTSVVRCRDCKKWDTDNITGSYPDGVRCYCARLSGGLRNWHTAPDDYCCFGERKENAE